MRGELSVRGYEMRSLLIFILLISANSCIYAQEQAVIVHFFNYCSRDLTRLFALEDKLEKAIASARP